MATGVMVLMRAVGAELVPEAMTVTVAKLLLRRPSDTVRLAT
jgi:hypothetical protein